MTKHHTRQLPFRFSIVFIWIFCLFISLSPAHAFKIIVKDGNGDPVKNIAVALFAKKNTKIEQAARQHVKQENKLFDPFVTVVQKGAKVNFPNKDRTRHHVYSFSKAKRFDLPLFLGRSKSITFDKAGVIALGCNIHDWMLAYVVVVDSPYHGKTNAQGLADIGDVPDGKYTLKYWYPGIKEKRKMVTLDTDVQASQKRYTINIPAGSMQDIPDKPLNADSYD